jgi:hypothetical protein
MTLISSKINLAIDAAAAGVNFAGRAEGAKNSDKKRRTA